MVKRMDQLLMGSSHGSQAGMQPSVATSFDLPRETRTLIFM